LIKLEEIKLWNNIAGTRLLLETNNVLLYGTFQPCYSTNKQTDKQTNKQTMEQTNTCLRSVTFHTPSTSVQLLTSNKISHDGETVVVKDHVTQLGHVTVTRGVTGYTVTAVNVTATWDGEVGWVVMVTCGSVTDTGLLGRPDCQLASTGLFCCDFLVPSTLPFIMFLVVKCSRSNIALMDETRS